MRKAKLFVATLLTCFLSIATADIQVLKWHDLNPEQKELIELAFAAREKAYAPYSRYQVGSALKTAEGHIFTGANVENASYGLTICAERVTVFKAVTEGKDSVAMLALVTKDGGMPCGACRQVIYEFNPKAEIIISDVKRKKIMVAPLNDLMPQGFGPQNLN